MKQQTAARHLVDALLAQSVTHVFCVPGESYLEVLDALYDVRDKIKTIACRNEIGAANMAEAHGKLTGRPGICMVTRGPGAAHAMVGVHTAKQDSTPLILFIGQVARSDLGREAFQEVDHAAAFTHWAKYAVQIEDAARTPEIVSRAFSVALQGRMGPVAVALPEDMLTESVEAASVLHIASAPIGLDPATLAQIEHKLATSERPIVILGGSGWDDEAAANIRTFLETHQLPCALSFRRKDILNNRSPSYAGDLGLGPNPKLVARVKQADLILAIGARLGENPTQGYTLFSAQETAQKLIHIHPDPNEIARVWPPALGAAADVRSTARALSKLNTNRNWQAWSREARADYEAFIKPIAVTGAVNLSECFAHLSATVPDDAILCNGAGNYAAWLHRFVQHRKRGTQLAPTSGAMGYGVPAAIAAKITHPEREVFSFAGDGCFLMSAQELATAVQYDAAVVFIVVDNASYGTIRMHQEREHPARTIATDLKNPDFAAYAESFGAWSTLVERTEDFPKALSEARAAKRPALIHIKTSVEDIAPGRTITSLRG